MEEAMAKDAGLPFFGIWAGKFRRYLSLRNGIDWLKIPVGILMAIMYMLQIRPRVLFSKGGYVSVPVVLAAWLLRVPVVIHESDVRPGLATRICSRFATTICVSWEATRQYFPHHADVRVTGVPIRAELLLGDRTQGRAHLGITNDLPLLMVMGGSLGAADINTFLWESLPLLLKEWNVYHLTGTGKNASPAPMQETKGMYIAQEFSDAAFADCLAAADVIFSRAGTTALAEFAALGKRLILCPLPADRSRGDQIDNAAAYKAMYPASTIVHPQQTLNTKLLLESLRQLRAVAEPPRKKEEATQLVASFLFEGTYAAKSSK